MTERQAEAKNPVVVVTGFGPFPGCAENPSGAIARRVDGLLLSNFRLVGLELQTSWQRGWQDLVSLMVQNRPLALLMLGVAPDPFFRLETLARNRYLPSPDIDGTCPGPDARNLLPLVVGAPLTYPACLLFDQLGARLVCEEGDGQTAVRKLVCGLEVRKSNDAGTYICNQVYYLARHYFPDITPHIGFVHVPPLQFRDGTSTGVVEGGIELIEQMMKTLSRDHPQLPASADF